MPVRPRNASSPDVIVVGAGCAGAVIARRLADAGADVLVLEAGPDTRTLPSLPATELPLSVDDPRARLLAARGREGDHVSVWRGQGPGGSGTINGAAWTPAPPEVVDSWPGFSARIYDEALARAEHVMAPAPVPTSALAAALASALGTTVSPGRLTIGVDGRRRNPWTAYAPDAAGAELRCGARINSLLVAQPNGKSTGVEGVILDDGGRLYAQDVVLAAGAIDSARLLRRAAEHPVVEATAQLARALQAAGSDGREHPEILLDVPRELGHLLASAPAGILGARIPLDVDGRLLEVRPYEMPFHTAIPGLPETPAQIGVALLDPHTASTVGPEDVHLSARPAPSDQRALDAGAALVHEALQFLAGGAVGNMTQSRRIQRGYSQHLYATAAIGEIANADGTIDGLTGLRVADGSLLPPGLGAGPYASIFAVAEHVAANLVTRRHG